MLLSHECEVDLASKYSGTEGKIEMWILKETVYRDEGEEKDKELARLKEENARQQEEHARQLEELRSSGAQELRSLPKHRRK